MSRNAPLKEGGALRDIQKTAAKETTSSASLEHSQLVYLLPLGILNLLFQSFVSLALKNSSGKRSIKYYKTWHGGGVFTPNYTDGEIS